MDLSLKMQLQLTITCQNFNDVDSHVWEPP